MLEKIFQSLREKLKDSQLKDTLAEELSGLLEKKPPGVRTDEYVTALAILILKEIKKELIKSLETEPEADPKPTEVPPLDCETIIKGLLIGMHHDLLESNLQMVKALGSAIAERDYGTNEHNFRVTLYSVNLAQHVKVENEQIKGLIKGSFLHDIGKIGIRDKTLLKPGGLTTLEYEDVKRHVNLGKHMLTNVRWLEDAIDVILYHHEKWDGTGYPEGLKADAIPRLARIFSVADVFDALTSERPYKKALSYFEAIDTMTREKGERFDPSLLDSFLEISEQLYGAVAEQDVVSLETTLLTTINRYFQFSPTIDDLRDAFGTIVKSGDDSR